MKFRFFLPLAVVGLFILSLFVGCTTEPKKNPPAVAPYNAKKELSQIQIELAAGSEKRAIQRLKNIIAKNPKTDVADDATMMLAKVYYDKGLYEEAYQTYMSLINSDVFSANEGVALLGAGKCLHKMGRLDEALALNARGLKIPGISDTLKLDFYKSRYSILTSTGDRMDALKALAYVFEHEPSTNIKANVQARANEIIDRYLSQSDLEKISRDSDMGFVRAKAAYRLGVIKLQSKNFDEARSSFASAAELGQNTPLQQQAENYIGQIDSRRHVDPLAIGTILPVTGKYASVAQKTLRGLQLGLGIYGPERSQFKLAVMDSESSPEAARNGVERLVSEDNVIAIVGSLLSRTAAAVASKSDELGVPSFALSQKSSLTDLGSYVFRNSVTGEMQMRELAHLAIDELGYKRFAILYPNDSYGVEYANLFWDEVLAHGGEITGAQIYSPSETDFRGPIRRLVGTYYLEDRAKEYQARVKEWFKKQKSLKGRNSPPDDLLPPIVDFDAIFVPDGPKALGQIAPMLAYQNINNMRLLGTNIWNTAELVRRGQKNVENALFVDTNIPNDPAFKNSRFFQEFKSTFNEEPGFFEAQGYEVGMLLRQLITQGEQTRIGLAQALAKMHQFEGITGPMVMNSNRELIRPLTPFVVNRGTIVTWDKSMESGDNGAKQVR